jgi:hypothetical protein
VVTPIYLEVGRKRVFACSIDWPGWCRSGKGEEAAMEALLAYQVRYRDAIGHGFPEVGDLDVVERVTGNGTTDFGAPDVVPAVDSAAVSPEEGARLASILRFSHRAFQLAVDGAPGVLPKGPRGGGRDRDGIVDHVREANRAYARKVGVKHPPGSDLAQTLDKVAELLEHGSDGLPVVSGGWPARYAVRRMAWHILDHAWELEDKSLGS